MRATGSTTTLIQSGRRGKGKLSRPTEFGYVFQLCELTENTRRGARGLILPAPTRVGSPNESDLLPATAAELQTLGLRPREGDRPAARRRPLAGRPDRRLHGLLGRDGPAPRAGVRAMIGEADVLARFERVERRRDGDWFVRYPAHADPQPSLHITRRGDRWLLHCFAGARSRTSARPSAWTRATS